MSEKITCQVCGAGVHIIASHLNKEHPGMTVENYREEYPDAPLLSDIAEKKQAELAMQKSPGSAVKRSAPKAEQKSNDGTSLRPLHEVFKLGDIKKARNKKGGPIPITVVEEYNGYQDFIPEVDKNYVFNVDLLKSVAMGAECNIPTYLWGHAGTGKTTAIEQFCAHTLRPYIRVQHSVNTEESHLLGQYIVKDGATVWEDGPLPVAMKYGLAYCADEYDFAMPHILSVYQPVLEGKTLVIKEAPAEHRIVRPHKNFRFFATGNTNGSGDETGLYQGTNMQNFANYERFGIVEQVEWMSEEQEILVVSNQAEILKEHAKKLVEFATKIRAEHDNGKISASISPRSLINAAKIGMRRGDYKAGLMLSYINRLNSVDREVCKQVAQRIFG